VITSGYDPEYWELAEFVVNGIIQPLLYESFESPDITSYTGKNPYGWNSYSDEPFDYDVGLWDMDLGLFTTPYGTQAVAIYGNTNTHLTTSNLILSDVLKDGQLYTLTFNVAKYGASDNYKVELLAGTTVLASASGFVGLDDMTVTDSVVFWAGPGNPYVGQPLSIRLHGDDDNVHWILYDNVLLESGLFY